MMDAKPLYPSGHHPVRLGYSLDTLYPVTALPRAGRKIRYFYIDFGLAMHFPKGSSTYVVGDVGRNARVPELSDQVPYDAFKVDIFALGDLLSKEFEQVCLSVPLSLFADVCAEIQEHGLPALADRAYDPAATRTQANR